MKNLLIILSIVSVFSSCKEPIDTNSGSNTGNCEIPDYEPMCAQICDSLFHCDETNKDSAHFKEQGEDPAHISNWPDSEDDCNIKCNNVAPKLQDNFLPQVIENINSLGCHNAIGNGVDLAFPVNAFYYITPEQNVDVYKYARCKMYYATSGIPDLECDTESCETSYMNYEATLIEYVKYKYLNEYYKCYLLEGGIENDGEDCRGIIGGINEF